MSVSGVGSTEGQACRNEETDTLAESVVYNGTRVVKTESSIQGLA